MAGFYSDCSTHEIIVIDTDYQVEISLFAGTAGDAATYAADATTYVAAAAVDDNGDDSEFFVALCCRMTGSVHQSLACC